MAIAPVAPCLLKLPNAKRQEEDRGLVAVTIGIVAGIEGYLTAGPGFGTPLLAFVIFLAIFDAMGSLLDSAAGSYCG